MYHSEGGIHERLIRYKKNCKRNDDDDDTDGGNEETALTVTFKGRCRGCGEYDHKESNCHKANTGTGGETKFTMKEDCHAWKKKVE